VRVSNNSGASWSVGVVAATHSATNVAGRFLRRPLAYFSGFGSVREDSCMIMSRVGVRAESPSYDSVMGTPLLKRNGS